MEEKKKKFIIPEAEIIDFKNEDIITLSVGTQGAEIGGGEDTDDFGNYIG